jgi:hypothetical protein
VTGPSWTWEIRTGRLLDPEGVCVGRGYSGFEEGKNNPDFCAFANVGPIPPGLYSIGPAYHHEHLGPVTMNLDPIEETDTFGRSLFRIHPDSIREPGRASHGCICLPRALREMIDASECRVLLVVEG